VSSTTLPYRAFDADNHYYEAPDAFTRHLDRRMASRAMQWAEIGGRQRLLVGGHVNKFIPNPLFDPVAKPGCLYLYFKGENPTHEDIRTLFGDLEPIHPEYRDREERIRVMDAQDLQATWMFPTLGVGMEQALVRDPEALVAAFHSFNQWLDEDWGFAYQNRIFSAPYITLVDVDAAVAEIESVIERGARIVNVRAAPVHTREGPKSPADPMFDPFWARVDEAGVIVASHGGDSGYGFIADQWEPTGDLMAFRAAPLRTIVTHQRDISDFSAALVCHGLFDRFQTLRIASIENGAGWVGSLKKRLAKAHHQHPGYFAEDPIDTFDRHFWIAPFWEDDLDDVLHDIAHDRIVFGSDWPHAEGTVLPLDYADTIAELDDALKKQILHDNAALVTGLPPA
jgi:predicted TIM-barrel fold metal-dependent hydrolase